MRKHLYFATSLLLVIFFSLAVQADENTERGVAVYPQTIYLTPDTSSQKIGVLERGREAAVLEHSGQWIHVLASMGPAASGGEKDVSGWMQDRGLVRKTTPNGDQILFGEAAYSEAQASQRGGRKGAAGDAFFLYLRTKEYFPNSPLGGEALYRAADIKWQLDRADVLSRPSAHARQAYLREGMNEDLMRKVMKKYPHTPWSDRAAFHLIENKLCGQWQGTSSCPKKESEMYEKYARERPDSPDAAEALYDAAWRQAALIQIYKTEEKRKDSDQAKAHAIELAQQIISKYPKGDWGDRAQTLLYMVQQDIPTYGEAAQ